MMNSIWPPDPRLFLFGPWDGSRLNESRGMVVWIRVRLKISLVSPYVFPFGECEWDKSGRVQAAAAAAAAMASTAKTVKDVPSHDFVRAYAAHLKRSGKIEVPAWSDLVKTATFKELAPYDGDWYYIRAASMARKIYLRQGIGVGAFRKIYGGRKSNGVRPSHFAKSSGSIARDCLKQLERLDIVEKDPKGGRRITSNGQRDLDQVAGRITVAAA